MTMVRPCRLITRQRSHMGLTEGLTFIWSGLSENHAVENCAKQGRVEAEASRRGPSWYQNPCFPRQDAGPLGGHGDGVLEMGRKSGVGGRARSAVVVDVDGRPASSDRRCARERHWRI